MSGKRKRPARRDADWNYDWSHAPTVDYAWGQALEQLMQFQNPNGVLALVANGAPVPDWARKEVAQWRRGKRPEFPGFLLNVDKQLLEAVRAVRDPAQKRKGENREPRIERIARERGFRPSSLRAFLNCRGGTYYRVVKSWKEWERVYLNPGLGFDLRSGYPTDEDG